MFGDEANNRDRNTEPSAQLQFVPADSAAVFSPRFLKWAADQNVSIVDQQSGEVLIEHEDWGRNILRVLPSGQVQVGSNYRGWKPKFEVSPGDDLERVLCREIGDDIRFQKGLSSIEYPIELARKWVQAPEKRLFDPRGRQRYRAYGFWDPSALSHLLRVNPRTVERSYRSRRGWPLRRILIRNPARQLLFLLLVGALVCVTGWAASAGDGPLTVALFVITGVPATVGTGLLAFVILLESADSKAWLRRRAVGPVVTTLAFLGVLTEVFAIYSAMVAAGHTWYYPLVALGIVAVVALVIVLFGVVAD